jgi:hypothetical protein
MTDDSRQQKHYTPLVRAEARELGVDLTAIAGTGVAGRVTVHDVRNAAQGVGRAPRPAHGAAASARPRLLVEVSSRFARMESKTVTVDVFGDNPLLEELTQTDPQIFAKAQARGAGPTPQLFTTGPLPAFTSSGIDPSALMQVPWIVRPAMARATRDLALQLVEHYGTPDQRAWEEALRMHRSDVGVGAYMGRMNQWFTAAVTQPALRLSDLHGGRTS